MLGTPWTFLLFILDMFTLNIQAPRRQPRKPLPRRRSPHKQKGAVENGVLPYKAQGFPVDSPFFSIYTIYTIYSLW